jgi:hypothetical protein
VGDVVGERHALDRVEYAVVIVSRSLRNEPSLYSASPDILPRRKRTVVRNDR